MPSNDAIEEDGQFTLESQNLPRCTHAEEISQYIKDATNRKQVNLDKLINIVRYKL